ncbi:MAG TPA: helix-turn-helix transcriptional regulator [Stackebrandtia sp.]|jgi:transcriptional regulator with XRE-family HTH domain|uniref:helix-turn-helix domain-containing protein n=1 Tax=Stackebrandtia sp. TaxID=2023065 RepID=UPI002D4E7620|nr:helix-turn-helix transcriptional regulator [Stackebrandtia sp.]HZE41072.1 helix-turn-helix transcriptional regulator [Stackebrandtia sp.]
MAKSKSSSLRAQWLGERLKKARKDAGLTLRETAEYLQLHEGTVSRFETATYPVRKSYIKDLVDYYGVSDAREREALLQLCEDAWRKDWWDGQASDVERGFIDYTWLEARAERICAFEPMLIHGLLQTEAYARAIIQFAESEELSDESLERLVTFRMLRQNVLNGSNPTRVTSILDPCGLNRQVGDRDVMRGQLSHLLELNQLNNVEILILPADTGPHAGMSGPFTLFEMPDPYSDVAFVESLVGQTYLEDDLKVAAFHRAYAELKTVALNPNETNKVIKQSLKDIE